MMPIAIKTLIAIEFLMAAGLSVFYYSLRNRQGSIIPTSTILLATITPIIALFCSNLYIFCGYLILAVGFNSRSRAELGANFVFILPLMPALSQETRISGVYLLAISAILAMSVGALVGFLATRGGKSYKLGKIDIGVALLIGIFLFIYNRDVTPTTLLRSLTANILSFVGPYLLISRGMQTRVDIERLLLRLCLGGTITAIIAIFQARKQWLLFQTYYDALHVPIPFGTATMAMRAGLLRTGGSMGDYSAAGIFFAVVITVMPLLKAQFRRTGYWAVLTLLIGGLLATQSRGAWIATILGLLVMLAYRKQWGRASLLLVAGIATGATILMLTPSGKLASLIGKTEEAAGTVSYRKLLAQRGYDQILTHPIFGQTPEQLIDNLPDLVQGQHIVDFVNAHLFIAMAAGIPLFIVWCCIWLGPVYTAWRHPARDTVEAVDLVGVPVAIIIPVMVGISATSIMDRNLNWPVIALALAGSCFALGRHQTTARSRQRSPLIQVGTSTSVSTVAALSV